jgi:hypothetical protein
VNLPIEGKEAGARKKPLSSIWVKIKREWICTSTPTYTFLASTETTSRLLLGEDASVCKETVGKETG